MIAGQAKVVGDENEALARFGIDETNTPKFFGVIAFASGSLQTDRLVAAKTGRFVDGAGLADIKGHIALGARDKKSAGLMKAMQSPEIDISAIHDGDASRLVSDVVEDVYIVDAPVRDAYEYRNRAPQVDHRVQLDRCFGFPEMSPGEYGQAKIDSRGIQGINHLLDVQTVGVAEIEASRPANENLSQIGVDAPVAILVGVSQVGARDIAAKSHRIKVSASVQARFDVAQTLPECHLSESHRQELIPRRKTSALPRHRVALDAPCQFLGVEDVHDLRKNRSTKIHSLLRMTQIHDSQPIQMQDILYFSYNTINQCLVNT